MISHRLSNKILAGSWAGRKALAHVRVRLGRTPGEGKMK